MPAAVAIAPAEGSLRSWRGVLTEADQETILAWSAAAGKDPAVATVATVATGADIDPAGTATTAAGAGIAAPALVVGPDGECCVAPAIEVLCRRLGVVTGWGLAGP